MGAFCGHCYELLGFVKITVECINNLMCPTTKRGAVYSSGQELGFVSFGHSDQVPFRSDVFFYFNYHIGGNEESTICF
jgi:hypothetical protein